VVRSNEKSCVCNVFATPYSKNPVKSSLPSYQNVNYTNYSRIYKKKYTAALEMQCFRGFSFVYVKITGKAAIEAAFCVFRLFLFL